MKTIYEYIKESLLDDEEDLLDSESTIVDNLINPETLLMSRDVFYKKVKEVSKKIRFKSEDIANDKIFQVKKIYVLFRPKYPEQLTLLYKPAANKNNLCQMNTSYWRTRDNSDMYRWVICKTPLKIIAKWMDKTYELYELPEKFYPLWERIHKKIRPSDDTFNIK